MIESVITWAVLNFSLPIFLKFMYFGSMIIMWFGIGMELGKSGEKLELAENFWAYVFMTAIAPLILVVLVFGWFYEQGKKHAEKKKARDEERRVQHYGNEEGLDDDALNRLGVDQRR